MIMTFLKNFLDRIERRLNFVERRHRRYFGIADPEEKITYRCPVCAGEGVLDSGDVCPECSGSGRVE